MIVRKTLDWRIIASVAWKRMLTILVISSGVVVLHDVYGHDHIKIDPLPASILGIAIAFLTSFRVNSAYDRWWEARRLWGQITNDSRTLARQATTFPVAPEGCTDGAELEVHKVMRDLVYRQIAFAYALKNSLRKLPVLPEIEKYLSVADIEYLKLQKNVPNAILELQGRALHEVHQLGFIDQFKHMQMDTKLSSICDQMGGCERIKNTVFPRQYSVYSTVFVKIYTYLLPFVLINQTGWIAIPSSLILGFIFFALDTIAKGIENPFENSFNDTPMSAICRTIEINLLQQLGEKDLPEPVEPVNGFLY
jgi:putative membrane protein